MQIDWSTLVLQTLNALILIWLLQRFLFRPVANIIAQRQQEACRILEQAKTVRTEAEAERGKAKQKLEEVVSHHNMALESADDDAAELKQALLEKARQEVNQILEQTTIAIAHKREQEKSNTEARATELALDIAEKLMQRLPNVSKVTGFIDGLFEALNKLPVAEREMLANSDHSLRLTSARALTEKENSEVKAALNRVLQKDVKLEIVIDPTLIAGLELEGPHCAVRNSFRSDIAYIEKTLSRDDTETT